MCSPSIDRTYARVCTAPAQLPGCRERSAKHRACHHCVSFCKCRSLSIPHQPFPLLLSFPSFPIQSPPRQMARIMGHGRTSLRHNSTAGWTAARRSSGARNARNTIRKDTIKFFSFTCFVLWSIDSTPVWGLSSSLRDASPCSLGIKDGESSCFALDELSRDEQGDCTNILFKQQQCVSFPFFQTMVNLFSFLPPSSYKLVLNTVPSVSQWWVGRIAPCRTWLPGRTSDSVTYFPHPRLSYRRQRCQASTLEGLSTLLQRPLPLPRMLATVVL